MQMRNFRGKREIRASLYGHYRENWEEFCNTTNVFFSSLLFCKHQQAFVTAQVIYQSLHSLIAFPQTATGGVTTLSVCLVWELSVYAQNTQQLSGPAAALCFPQNQSQMHQTPKQENSSFERFRTKTVHVKSLINLVNLRAKQHSFFSGP